MGQRRLPRTSLHGRRSTNGFAISRGGGGQVAILKVRGPVDVTCCRRVSSAVNEALETRPQRLVLDLHRAELIDPAALAVLLSARRQANRLGIALKLVCDAPNTLKVLSLTGLDRSFDISTARA